MLLDWANNFSLTQKSYRPIVSGSMTKIIHVNRELIYVHQATKKQANWCIDGYFFWIVISRIRCDGGKRSASEISKTDQSTLLLQE